LPVRVVPEAKAVTRLFSNDESAEELLGVRPSLLSVWKAARIAVSWPTVVPEASSIVWTSLRSVWRAVVSAVLEPVVVLVLPVEVELAALLARAELAVLPVEVVLATELTTACRAWRCNPP
jgi:hypothetical protein